MEVFLARIRQLLPVLGSDLLTPIAQPAAKPQPGGVLFCRIKGAEARGQRTASGFVENSKTRVLSKIPLFLVARFWGHSFRPRGSNAGIGFCGV